MITSSPEEELLTYLAAFGKSVAILIVQECDGLGKLVYYLCCLLRGSEKNYSFVDKLCVVLMYIIQKLRYYMATHKVKMIMNSDPIKLLLQKPNLTGQYAK